MANLIEVRVAFKTPDGMNADQYMRISEQCATCANLITAAQCRAFPEGIPKEIFLNGRDHTVPYPGDQGIRYEPLPGITLRS